MLKNEIIAKKAVSAIGPYSQAIEAGGFVFISGQIGKEPGKEELVKGVGKQTELAIKSIFEIVKAAGGVPDDIVKTTVYLLDFKDYKEMNTVYGELLKKPYPARATIQVAELPRKALVEIEAVAYIK